MTIPENTSKDKVWKQKTVPGLIAPPLVYTEDWCGGGDGEGPSLSGRDLSEKNILDFLISRSFNEAEGSQVQQ